MKTNEKKKKINIGVLIFRIVSLIIILVCVILLIRWNNENNKNSSLAESLSDTYITGTTQSVSTDSDSSDTYDSLDINFTELLNTNSDTVAWIKISDTNINFPIVKSTDNSYYLKHNFNKEYNSAGWIFADYRNNFSPSLDKNTIVYGHNRRNGTMFSNLNYFLNTSWYTDNENHKYFNFSTSDTNYIAQIFSVYKISQNDLTLSTSFSSEDDFEAFINDCQNKSIYNFDVTVSNDDNILTLCTCDNNTQYRIVIHAKLVSLENID